MHSIHYEIKYLHLAMLCEASVENFMFLGANRCDEQLDKYPFKSVVSLENTLL